MRLFIGNASQNDRLKNLKNNNNNIFFCTLHSRIDIKNACTLMEKGTTDANLLNIRRK